MKAKLVNIDLMVRILVPDEATDEQCYDLAVDKALENAYDSNSNRSWFAEGMSDLVDDEEMPFGACCDDKPKDIIGYQIESVDGRHIVPDAFWSFEIFATLDEANAWLFEEAILNPKNRWKIVPIQEGVIENVSYVDMKIL